jgi:hypothetical protein
MATARFDKLGLKPRLIYFSELIHLKYVRKITKRIIQNSEFGTMCVPKAVIDAWKGCNFVEILFDERNRTLVVTPYNEG